MFASSSTSMTVSPTIFDFRGRRPGVQAETDRELAIPPLLQQCGFNSATMSSARETKSGRPPEVDDTPVQFLTGPGLSDTRAGRSRCRLKAGPRARWPG